MFNEVLNSSPSINYQLPRPQVVEANGDVINLEAPFTLELPSILSDSYTDVLLVFVNTDGSYIPQAVVHTPFVSNLPTQGKVNNRDLSPPFTSAHTAVLQCFIRLRQTEIWQRTPDSVVYSLRT
jgi:hypothetical protein